MFIAEKNCVTLQNSMKWVHFRNVSRPVVGDGCDRQNVEQEGPWSAGDQQHHLPSEKRSTTLKDPSIWLAVLKNFKWLLLPWPLFRLWWLEQCGVVSLKKWIIEEVLLVVGLLLLAYGQIMGTTFYGWEALGKCLPVHLIAILIK